MPKPLIATILFTFATIIIFLLVYTVTPKTDYLTEEQVKSELNIK